MRWGRAVVAVAVTLVTACGGAPTASTSAPTAARTAAAVTTASTAVARAGQVMRDVTYCTMDGVEQKLDVYFPRAPHAKDPAVVYFHGGGLIEGDKRSVTALDRGDPVQASMFTDAGFVFVSVNYRLGPQFKFPAMIEDAKCAVRHLRAEAQRYAIDPDRIGLMGSSSGSYLAQLIGLSDSKVFEKGAYPGVSTRVRAVFSDYGAETNLEIPAYSGYSADSREKSYPANMTSEFKKAASAITYVSGDDPPMYLTHGDHDPAANPQNSKDMYAALTAAGVPATLVMVKNGGHGWDEKASRFGPIDPTQLQLAQSAVSFFEKYLKG